MPTTRLLQSPSATRANTSGFIFQAALTKVQLDLTDSITFLLSELYKSVTRTASVWEQSTVEKMWKNKRLNETNETTEQREA